MADENTKNFGIDSSSDGSTMPDLTTLLMRKKITKTGPSVQPVASSEPALAMELNASEILPDEPVIEEPSGPHIVRSNVTAGSRDFQNQPASRPGAAETPRIIPSADTFTPTSGLEHWSKDSLKTHESPVAKALLTVESQFPIQAGVVFVPNASGQYVACAAVTPGDREALWRGMNIDPTEFADLWGRLVKFGFSEFSTLGTAGGHQNSNRSAFRIAFGANGREWVTLIRVGSPTDIQAIAVLLTTTSIQQALIPFYHVEKTGLILRPAAA